MGQNPTTQNPNQRGNFKSSMSDDNPNSPEYEKNRPFAKGQKRKDSDKK